MEKIIVDVAWCDKNFGGSLGSNVPGAVVFTAPTFEALQKEAKDSLEFHVEGLLENGEEVPEWLKNGDYTVAIEEGATMVRVGTGIFGERDYSKAN